MKKLLLFTLFILFSGTASAQTIDGKTLDAINVDFLQLEEVSRLFSTKIFIKIDFGQKTKLISDHDEFIKDESGSDKEFNLLIDGLNFMSKFGYEFHSAIPVYDTARPIKKYILKRKIIKSNKVFL